MASLMSKNLELGLELTSDDLAAEVKSDVLEMFKSIVKDAEGDDLINMFGADVANKIRKSDLRKLQEKQGQVFKQSAKQETPSPSRIEKRPPTIDEWKEEIERRVRENP